MIPAGASTTLTARINGMSTHTHTNVLYSYLPGTSLHYMCFLDLKATNNNMNNCTGFLSTCYNHFIPLVGVGKERRTFIGPW